MEVLLTMSVGGSTVSRRIKLDFVPVPGMRYDDGTWKGNASKEITNVTIERSPDTTVSLVVALEPDESGSLDTYESHDWEID